MDKDIDTPAATTVLTAPAAVDPAVDPAVVVDPAANAADPAAVVDPAAKAADPAAVEYTDFVMPEGVEIDVALMEKAMPIFKELNLTQEQAQKLVDLQAADKVASPMAQAETYNKLMTEWQTQAQNDKEFGGDNFKENIGIARLAVDKFGTPEFKQLMEDHGVGNHPEMIRFMLKIGKSLKEDVPGSSGGAVSAKTDRVSILYPQK